MAIKPGRMGSPALPNTPAVYADSMAAHIESAFNALLEDEGLARMPDDNSKESRDRCIRCFATRCTELAAKRS